MAGILQTKAYRILQTRVNDCLLKYGLNHGQWVMLGIIADVDDGIQLNVTAEIMGVKAPLITAMAHELISLGYIKRVTREHDRRAKLLTVSEKGQLVLQQAQVCLNEVFGDLLDGLSKRDLEIYHKVLDTIIKNNDKSTTV